MGTIARTDLLLNYRKLPADITAGSSALIVGPSYSYYKSDTSTEYNRLGAYPLTSSLVTAWPNIGAGEVPVTATAQVFIDSPIVRYFRDTAVTPSATEGTQYGSDLKKITRNSQATIWTGSSFTAALNVPVAIGDYVKLDNNAGGTLETVVTDFEYISGAPKILVLRDPLPTALQTGYFNVILGEISTTSVTPTTTLTTSTITVASGVTTSTHRTGSAYTVISGTLADGTKLGSVYVNYQTTKATAPFINVVKNISTTAELSTYFKGYEYPESVLGFGVARALSPEVEGVDPATVYFVAPISTSSTDYGTLITAIENNTDFGVIALLSTDPTIILLFETLVDDRRAAGIPTQLYIGETLNTLVQVASTSANIDDASSPGLQRTITAVSGTPFTAVVAGDVVYHYVGLTYTPYIVQTKISNSVLVTSTNIAGGPLAAQTITVQHLRTPQEAITAYGAIAQGIANQSVNLVAPFDCTWSGQPIAPYFLAAAIAGLRGYTAPQQTLSDVQLETGWGRVDPRYDSLAEAQSLLGVFVCSGPTGLTVRYANTTDQSTAYTRREAIVADVYSASRYITAALNPYISATKTIDATLLAMENTASNACSTLRSAKLADLGGVIRYGIIGTITLDPLDDSKVVVPVTLNVATYVEYIDVLDVQVTLSI